jgi:sensor histidine kinase regulating citrate/malate metabolism
MLFHAKNEFWSTVDLLDQDNNVIAAVVTLRDISKYKQLEQELKKQKKYRNRFKSKRKRTKK